MAAFINLIGTAVPNVRIAQGVLAQFMKDHIPFSVKESHHLDLLYRASGIQFRHSIIDDFKNGNSSRFFNEKAETDLQNRMRLYEVEAPKLAINAIKNGLNKYDLSQLTHLITVSCTGMYAPGIDLDLLRLLDLNPSIERTAINFMGCYGVFNALKLAQNICNANSTAQVLVVSVELCTLHFQRATDQHTTLSQALFADGAACCLVTGYASSEALKIENFHCDVDVQGWNEMSWKIGKNAFHMMLTQEVPMLIEGSISSLVNKLLKKSPHPTLRPSQFAIHPGGKGILKAIETGLNISKEQNRHAYQVLKHYGNMSSATILFVLKEMLKEPIKAPEDVLALAFCPGLTLESMLLKAARW